MGACQIPLFLPPSDWTMPNEFPDLRGRGAKWLSIDIESRDPYLKEKGPGYLRKDAYIIGVSVAAGSGHISQPADFCRYFPTRHAEGGNLSPNIVKAWLKDQLAGNLPIFGANLPYDLGGLLIDWGIPLPNAPIMDVQVAEPILDENAMSYSLDTLGWKYLKERKDESLLVAACQAFGLGHVRKGVRSDYKGEMYRLPAKYVGPYAEQDSRLPPLIFAKQILELRKHDLEKVWEMERRVTPLMVRMYVQGVNVDLDRADQVRKELLVVEDRVQGEINAMAGERVDVQSPDSLSRVFTAHNIPFPRTALGSPSFVAKWLDDQDWPVAQKIVELRKATKMRRDFVTSAILGSHVNGRIHATFNQLRRDTSGTRSGRFSCVNPNLQQIPSRDPYYGPLLRSMFIPEHGCQWSRLDYSQQEFRLSVHYGFLRKFPGAAEARQAYIDNPLTDFHQFVADLTGLTRKVAKNVNLGLSYWMGLAKLAKSLGVSLDVAQAILEQYYEKCGFVKLLNKEAAGFAQVRGWVKTTFGFKAHFDLWEPSRRPTSEDKIGLDEGRWRPIPLGAAEGLWEGERLQRGHTHKAFNRIIQGTAAGMGKLDMIAFAEEGILAPLIVHDEFDDPSFNDFGKLRRMKEIMESIHKFSVPMIADASVGSSWGSQRDVDWASVSAGSMPLAA